MHDTNLPILDFLQRNHQNFNARANVRRPRQRRDEQAGDRDDE